MNTLTFRKYPSITALQCFECLARHLSFTKAGKELHMTQSAVSKQVAQPEELLGVQLFLSCQSRLSLRSGGLWLSVGENIADECVLYQAMMDESLYDVLAQLNARSKLPSDLSWASDDQDIK